MRLLRMVTVFLGVALAVNAYGQSNSPDGKPAESNQEAQAPAAQISGTHDQEKTPAPNGQNTQSVTGTKSDSQSDEHHRRYHVRLGTIGVGAVYGRFSGPFFYNPFWYGLYPYSFGSSPFFYDPFFYSPFYAPGYFGGFSYSDGKGEVKLSGAPKTAEVYLDGAYAGTANNLKTMWLEPGAYDLSVSTSGSTDFHQRTFHQRIYVLSGKSLKIAAKLTPQETKPKMEEKQ